MTFSFSQLDAFYNVCAEQARQLYYVKPQRYKKTYTVEGGIDIHREIEKRIKSKKRLPDDLSHAEGYVRSLERTPGTLEPEVQLAVDRNLNYVDYWSPSAWLRGKFDAVVRDGHRAVVIDWKSGKVREKSDQLELGALLLFEKYQGLHEISACNIWLKTQQIGERFNFRREEKDKLWPKWIAKMKAVEGLDPNDAWDRRQGPLCSFCPVKECPHYRGG